MPRYPTHLARRLLGTGLLLLFLGAFHAEAQGQSRVALVIGNGAYRHTAQLANPRRDAAAVSQALRAIGFEVMERLDQDRAGMVNALRDFGARASGADVALVFYAGHGLQIARGGGNAENYLVPTDARLADIRDVDDDTLALSRLLERVDGARSRIVILDACRDNPLAQQMRGGGSRSAGRGLAPPEGMARGTLLVFSTDPGQVALDGSGANSPFTEALVAHLPTPGIEMRQMLTRVRNDVNQRTGGRQTPWSSDGLLHEMYLAGLPVPVPAPPPLAAPPVASTAREEAFWRGIEGSRDTADLEEYLRLFPSGLFTSLAQRRLASLLESRAREAPAPAPTGCKARS